MRPEERFISPNAVEEFALRVPTLLQGYDIVHQDEEVCQILFFFDRIHPSSHLTIQARAPRADPLIAPEPAQGQSGWG